MNESAAWYNQLTQPFFAPPAWVFGPVWTVLYVASAVSFGYVVWLAFKRRIPRGIALPFATVLKLSITSLNR